MFTGIVEELGRVRATDERKTGTHLAVECTTVLADAAIGSSIAVNGCCLTVVELGDGWWAADVQRETLERTTLGDLQSGAPVNLERSIRLADRLGGHLVQGHVDVVGTVSGRDLRDDGSAWMTVAVPAGLLRFVAEKGSVALDGVSLTVAGVDDRAHEGSLAVALVPHTLGVTTLGDRRPGDGVNVEVDVLAKYVERLVANDARSSP